ncbi:MAG: hypothetical protein ACLVJ6_16850 [Merdibacter sp.]
MVARLPYQHVRGSGHAAQNGELEYIIDAGCADRWTFHEQKYRKAMKRELITLQPAGPIEQRAISSAECH